MPNASPRRPLRPSARARQRPPRLPFRLALTALVAVVIGSGLALPGVARAATAPASGSITAASPTDTYPTGSPTPCVSQSGAPTHYAKVSFTTDGASATTISLSVQPTGFRAVIALYQGSYYPGNSVVNCYNGSAIGSSSGASVSWTAAMGALPPGFTSEPWDLVVWGYSAADVGAFTASISSSTTGVTITSAGAPADTTAPVVTVPADKVAEATGASGAAVTYAASASDAVDGSLTPTCAPASGATFPLGATTVTCRATDAAGNTGTSTFKVTVRDTTAPAVTVPSDRTVTAAGPSGTAVSYGSSATDAVSGSLTPTCSPASGATFPLGATTVTCRATDAAGNTGTSTFKVTVRDTGAPVVTVPADRTLEAAGPSGAATTFSASAADDVDGALTPTCAPASGATFPLGATTVTCRATDAAGNTGTSTFEVTVRDTTAPVVTAPEDLSVEASSAAGSTVAFVADATDTVDGDLTATCAPGSGATYPIGTTTVTCRATDAAGNTGTASFTVTVRDSAAPVLTVPADLAAEAADADGAAVTYAASAADAVDGDVTPTCSPASGATFPVGTTTVTCRATDAARNTGTASFAVTVGDTTAPTVTVPADRSVEATSPDGAAVTYATSAVDAVDGSLTSTCAPASGATFPLGATTVTCRATDAAGNTGSASFTVTVGDSTAPAVTVPADRVVEATGAEGADVTFGASATDAVDGAPAATCAPASGTAFPLGATTVTCRATDAAGNTGTASFTVTVRDTTAPLVTVPADLAVPADDPTGARVVYAAGATDVVDGTLPVTCTPASGTRFAVGSTAVTCRATDAAGNAASASFAVRVRGVVAPRITAHVVGARRAGWYTGPVRVTWTCVAGSARLVGGCPAAVELGASGRGRAVARSVRAADGGTATARAVVDIDRTAPTARIAGVTAGRTYLGTAPTARCVARDALSGVARCTLRTTRSGHRTTVVATARDRAGNVTTKRRSYVVLPAYLTGVRREGQRFVVHPGSTYTLVVASNGPAPVYRQAALEGHRPGAPGPVLQPAGKGRWQVRIRITPDMLSHARWVVGVDLGSRVELVHLTVRR